MTQENTASDGHEQSTGVTTRPREDAYEDQMPAEEPATGCPFWEEGRMPRPKAVGGMLLFQHYLEFEPVEVRISLPEEQWKSFVRTAERQGVRPRDLMYDLVSCCGESKSGTGGHYTGLRVSYDGTPSE